MKIMMCFVMVVLCTNLIDINGRNLKMEDDNIQTVEYCDLLKSPELFNGQEVRLTTTYIGDFEQSEFYDKECNEPLALWVDFDKSYEKLSNKKVLNKFFGRVAEKLIEKRRYGKM